MSEHAPAGTPDEVTTGRPAELAAVDRVMAAARAAAAPPTRAPAAARDDDAPAEQTEHPDALPAAAPRPDAAVHGAPGAAEISALHEAHDALRAVLDQVERGR